jgi:hypothetical protein
LAEAADENFDLFTDAANRFLPVLLLIHMHVPFSHRRLYYFRYFIH